MKLVLLNPNAQGGRAARFAPFIQTWLKQHYPDVIFASYASLAESIQCIRQLPRNSRVIAIGGDGTINRWLPSILEGQHELGVVPLGSGNDVARAIGVFGMSWQEALRHALTHSTFEMDVGVVSYEQIQTPYLSSLAAGFDAAVCKNAIEGPKWLRGLPRYLWATLKELAQIRNWDLLVHADGQLIREGACLLVSTLNTPTYGSGMPIVPDAQINDGQLNVMIAQGMGSLKALEILPKLLTGSHVGHSKINMLTLRELTIRSVQALPLASDGEYLGTTHELHIGVYAQRLPVVMNL
jgi:diacylglycerol kinase (ATP)